MIRVKHIFTSIDIGSDTIKIVVCELFNNKLNLLAASSVKSRGIKKGLIADAYEASACIKEGFNELEEMLGITTCAIRSFVSRHKIPSKKEHGIAYYLRSAIIDVNNTLAKYADLYFTVEQICEKFNMDRDNVYSMVRYNDIRKVQEGRFALFLKEDVIRVIHERQFT